jgi:manganese/zinc/iron transport system ATP- binding protein
LWDITLEVPQGKLVAIIGPNGAGKSTLIRACLELTPRLFGQVKLLGLPFHQARANVAYVPQKESVDWDFPITVRELITMGCFGKLGWLGKVTSKEHDIVNEALLAVGLEAFENRQIHQLSGGQQQRAFLGRALAQKANLYFMDEPFAGVDMATEQHLIGVMKGLCKKGSSVFVVHHDLKSVQQNFDWVVVVNKHLIAHGPVEDCLTPAVLQQAYGKPIDHLLYLNR